MQQRRGEMPTFLGDAWLGMWLFSLSWQEASTVGACLYDTVQAGLPVRQSDAGSAPPLPRVAGGAVPLVRPNDSQAAPGGAPGVPGARRPASSRREAFPAARSTLSSWPSVVRPG